MKKVPVELIPVLLEQEEIIRSARATMQALFTPPVLEQKVSATIDIYSTGVPENGYLVKVLSIKCHNADSYKMTVEIIDGKYAGHVVTGYSRRYSKEHGVLADCFSYGVLHNRAAGYVGETGYIFLHQSGWIDLFPRKMVTGYFPECAEVKEDFENYYQRPYS